MMRKPALRKSAGRKRMLPGLLALALLAGTGCHASDSVSRFSQGARAEAKKWQADAELVEIHAGSFQMIMSGSSVMKSGPPQIMTFYFFSPSTRRAFHVDAMAQGLQPHADELAFSPFTLPIPDNFASLDEAIAQVRKSNGSDILVTEADLRVYWNAAGQPDRTAWKITFGQAAATARSEYQTHYVDARSGTLTTVEDRSVEAPNTGSTGGAPPTDTDYATLRRAADESAATRGAGFKLYALDLVFQLPDPQYFGAEKPGSRVHFIGQGTTGGHFEYARSTPTVNWESVDLGITSGGTSIGPVVERTPPTVMPHTLPANLPDPEPFLRQLRDAFPPTPPGYGTSGQYHPYVESGGGFYNTESYTAHLWLSRQGDARPMDGEPPDEGQYAFFTSTAPHDRWVWWTIVEYAREARRPGHPPSGTDPVWGWQHFIYIDAVSGARSTRCTVPRCIDNCGLEGQPPPPMPLVECK